MPPSPGCALSGTASAICTTSDEDTAGQTARQASSSTYGFVWAQFHELSNFYYQRAKVKRANGGQLPQQPAAEPPGAATPPAGTSTAGGGPAIEQNAAAVSVVDAGTPGVVGSGAGEQQRAGTSGRRQTEPPASAKRRREEVVPGSVNGSATAAEPATTDAAVNAAAVPEALEDVADPVARGKAPPTPGYEQTQPEDVSDARLIEVRQAQLRCVANTAFLQSFGP